MRSDIISPAKEPAAMLTGCYVTFWWRSATPSVVAEWEKVGKWYA